MSFLTLSFTACIYLNYFVYFCPGTAKIIRTKAVVQIILIIMFISVIVVPTVFVCLALFSCAGDRIYSLTPGAGMCPELEDIIHKLVTRDLSRSGHNNARKDN